MDFRDPGGCYSRQLRVLNRILSWNNEGIAYKADQQRAELLVEAMGVAKPVWTPGSREDAARAEPPSVICKTTQKKHGGDAPGAIVFDNGPAEGDGDEAFLPPVGSSQ